MKKFFNKISERFSKFINKKYPKDMKELTKFIEWYQNLGGQTSHIDFADLYVAKFYDYD